MMKLKQCPCGQLPSSVIIQDGNTCKWAWVGGNCCGDWFTEFRTNYHGLETPECKKLAEAAWNNAGRTEVNDG